MEWPVLGRKRALPAQEEKPAKNARKLAHWSFKLALVIGKARLPDEVGARIESYMTPPQFKTFYEKYGSQAATYRGLGFVTDWHPRIASKTRERHIWDVYSKDVPPSLAAKRVKPLLGMTVNIVYSNAMGKISRMDPKRVTHAGPYSMVVDHGPGTPGFTLSYAGVQSITLHVDVRL
jgi:hypothetical protein